MTNKTIDAAEQCLINDFEQQLVSKGIVPSTGDFALRRSGELLARLGGVAIGFVIANVTVLINFLLFNFILHIGA